ncbi:unnamed protein product, partial [Amoebophrya sp. A120]
GKNNASRVGVDVSGSPSARRSGPLRDSRTTDAARESPQASSEEGEDLQDFVCNEASSAEVPGDNKTVKDDKPAGEEDGPAASSPTVPAPPPPPSAWPWSPDVDSDSDSENEDECEP